jgi:hypothetical protein
MAQSSNLQIQFDKFDKIEQSQLVKGKEVGPIFVYFPCFDPLVVKTGTGVFPILHQIKKDVVIYRDLSNRYVYSIESESETDEDGERTNITSIKISVITKAEGRLVQQITIPFDGETGPDQFLYPSDSRSSVTGARLKDPVVDGDHGDFVVHDFNFDGKEDFALKDDVGGNRGPHYRFYVAGDGGLLQEDEFLNTFGLMPKVDPQKKILSVASYNYESGRVSTLSYRYDPVKKKWSKIL